MGRRPWLYARRSWSLLPLSAFSAAALRIVSVTVQDASDGDTATLPETLIMAAEQVELVQPDGPGVDRGSRRQGVPQRRDAGGARRGGGSESRP